MNGRKKKGKKGGGKEERRKGGRNEGKKKKRKGEIKQRSLLGFPYTFNSIFVYVI